MSRSSFEQLLFLGLASEHLYNGSSDYGRVEWVHVYSSINTSENFLLTCNGNLVVSIF
jgi:hypothetical protein